MKDHLASLLRHAFTSWIAAAVMYLTAKLVLDAAAVQAVESALKQIGDGLLLLIITLAPIAGRLAWSWGATIFQRGAGEQGTNDTSPSGGMGLILAIGTAAVLMGGLPSCTAEQLAAARQVPIRATVHTDQGDVSYSSKGGLGVEIDASSGK